MDYKFLNYITEKESAFLKKEVNGGDLIRITDANNYFNMYMDRLKYSSDIRNYDCPNCAKQMTSQLVKHLHCQDCKEHYTTTPD